MIKSCHPEDELAYLRGILQMLEAEGEAAEIGVYHGATAQIIQQELLGREIHLFDTFGGIPSEYAEENWPNGAYRCSLDDVRSNIGEDFIFHKGDIVKTKIEAPSRLCFVHFDLDVYFPLQDSLGFFYDKLSPGGVMLVSNYDRSHPGVIRAVDEFNKTKRYKRYSRYVTLKHG